MSQNSLVVPVRIILEKQSVSHFFDSTKSGLYNDKGEEFLLIKKTEPKSVFNNFEGVHFAYWTRNIDWSIFGEKKNALPANEYTDDLFLEQINVKSISDAHAFLEKYSHYAFILPELISNDGFSYEFSEGQLITQHDYLEIMLNRIQAFLHIQEAYFALVDYSADLPNTAKAHCAFRKCLDYFHSQHLTSAMGLSDDIIKNPDIKIDGEDAFIMLNMRTKGETNRFTLSECKKYIDEIIRAETQEIFIEQCLDDFTFEYHCPTLSAAMYEKMLLSAFSKDEYRQCAKCSAYYKVDKSHPQTLCDKHMAARRRKRQNAKDKDKAEEASSRIDIL